MRDPFSYMTYYTYDNRNRLTGAGASTTNRDVVYTYYANNLVKDITLSNGNQTWLTYKGLQLQTMRHQKADGTQLHTFTYAYDGNGNVTNRSGTQAGMGFNENFTYDPLSRIQTASPFNESYTYDNRDNRAPLQSEQLLSSLSLAERTYEYDSQNRLTKATVDGQEVRYRYNGDGLLYERTESGVTTRYYYDGSDVIAEGTVAVNGTAAFKARYVRGHGLAARQDVSGKAYYLHNGHGDVIELRDSTGNLPLNRYTYDIWGNTLSATETVANPFRYSGELWDSTTELQYLRARWYDPSIGRFINKDTYEGSLTNPLTLNLYTYTANNPLRYIDPSGHAFEQSAGFGGSTKDAAKTSYLRWKLGDTSAFDNAPQYIKNEMIRLAKSDWSVKDAIKWFVGGFIAGAALVSPAAIISAFEMASMGTTTAAITAGTATTSRAVVTIGLTKGAGLFESSFIASSGIKIGGIAETTIKGKHITLTDIAIYADGVNDAKNLVGAKEIIQWRNAVIEELKKQGYETLTIQGIRVGNSTSTNPGMTINRTFDLTK